MTITRLAGWEWRLLTLERVAGGSALWLQNFRLRYVRAITFVQPANDAREAYASSSIATRGGELLRR